MENQYDPERSSPENIQPTYVRPPGLEFAMGAALFALILMVFFLVQSAVFIQQVVERSPEFESFHMGLLQDPAFQQRMEELIFHGDMVALEALWSGLVGLVLIIVSVRIWKRKNFSTFLGLGTAPLKQYLKWIGIFLVLGLIIEVLTRYVPGFESDFMSRILATSTNQFLLFLGVGLMAPVFEEFLLRGLLLGSLRHMADEHVAVALSAGVFTLMHMQYNTAILLLILPMGVLLGYARTRTGSIWVPVVIHVINNSISVLMPQG
jgi:uncharacterized protein